MQVSSTQTSRGRCSCRPATNESVLSESPLSEANAARLLAVVLIGAEPRDAVAARIPTTELARITSNCAQRFSCKPLNNKPCRWR